MRALNERGLTLTELAIVGAMGLLVMTAIMGFYMNCQTLWTDASSKSILCCLCKTPPKSI